MGFVMRDLLYGFLIAAGVVIAGLCLLACGVALAEQLGG
jgi:hypothetical protein